MITTDPKAAATWLSDHRRRPTRDPYSVVTHGDLLITSSHLASLPDDELYSVLEQVAIAALETSRFDLAESCISRLQSKFPASQRVKSLQGMMLEAQGKGVEAVRFYDEALYKEPTSLILSRRRIAALKGLGENKKAIEALNAHLDIFYNDPEAWQELAEVYASEGMYAQSAFALEEVILQVPQDAFMHLKYAETLYTNNEVAKAYKAYLRVLEMCQSDGGSTTAQGAAQGPWLRALWGTKMAATALIVTPSSGGKNRAAAAGEDAIDPAKVKKIDALVTGLLLNKVYTPHGVENKLLRDTARAVLAA